MNRDAKKPYRMDSILLIACAIATVGGLAVWNVIKVASMSPEVNGIYGSGPLPHVIHAEFVLAWIVAGVISTVVLFAVFTSKNKTLFWIATVSAVSCLLFGSVNFLLYWACVASV